MRLADYLEQENLTYAEFGRRCVPEIPRVSIRQYALYPAFGGRLPRKAEIFETIRAASGGAVTANDFVLPAGVAA
jgi:hypothetical protein